MLTLRRSEHLFRYLVGCKLDKGLIQKDFPQTYSPIIAPQKGGLYHPLYHLLCQNSCGVKVFFVEGIPIC